MDFLSNYLSPVGDILLSSNEAYLTGLWIGNQRQYAGAVEKDAVWYDTQPLLMCKRWLDAYFAGEQPDISQLQLSPSGNQFRQTVWQILKEIPYGTVVTYGDLAKETARRMGKERMSAQAIGGAVGRNPISLIIPCHRVIGSGGSLTGYAGGIDIKAKLLQHEGAMRNDGRFAPERLWKVYHCG